LNEENYIPISDNALKLSLSSHLVTLVGGELGSNEAESLKALMNSIMDAIWNSDRTVIEAGYFNFISKFTDNHDLEAKTAQKLVNSADEKITRNFISMQPEEFLRLGQEAQFQFLFQFILGMGVDVQKGYEELDMLEAQALNKTVYR
jgi:hypothetical protein